MVRFVVRRVGPSPIHLDHIATRLARRNKSTTKNIAESKSPSKNDRDSERIDRHPIGTSDRHQSSFPDTQVAGIGRAVRVAQTRRSPDLTVRTATTGHLQGFFNRSDALLLHVEKGILRRSQLPPANSSDVTDATFLVSGIEGIIGYTFKNKLMCLEALAPGECSLHWNGGIKTLASHQRLALLGDRTLGIILCELWWDTKSSPGTYSQIEREIESRHALFYKGIQFGLHEFILTYRMAEERLIPIISETVEAIIGAVYEDSNRNFHTVKQVLDRLGFQRDFRLLMERFGKGEYTLLKDQININDLKMTGTSSRHVVWWRTHLSAGLVPPACLSQNSEKSIAHSSADDSKADNGLNQHSKELLKRTSTLAKAEIAVPAYPNFEGRRQRNAMAWKMINCEMQIAKNPSALTTIQHKEILKQLRSAATEMDYDWENYPLLKARVVHDCAALLDLYEDINEQVRLISMRVNAVDQDSRRRIAGQVQLLRNWMTYIEANYYKDNTDAILKDGVSMLKMIADDGSVRALRPPSYRRDSYRRNLRKKKSIESELASASPLRRRKLQALLIVVNIRLQVYSSLYPNLVNYISVPPEQADQSAVTVDVSSESERMNAGDAHTTTPKEDTLPLLEPHRQSSEPQSDLTPQTVQNLTYGQGRTGQNIDERYTVPPTESSAEEQNIDEVRVIKTAAEASLMGEGDLKRKEVNMVGPNQALKNTSENNTDKATLIQTDVMSDVVDYERYIDLILVAFEDFKAGITYRMSKQLEGRKKIGLSAPETTLSQWLVDSGEFHIEVTNTAWMQRFFNSNVYTNLAISSALAMPNIFPIQQELGGADNSGTAAQAVTFSRSIKPSLDQELVWRIMYDLFLLSNIYMRDTRRGHLTGSNPDLKRKFKDRLQIVQERGELPSGTATQSWSEVYRRAKEAARPPLVPIVTNVNMCPPKPSTGRQSTEFDRPIDDLRFLVPPRLEVPGPEEDENETHSTPTTNTNALNLIEPSDPIANHNITTSASTASPDIQAPMEAQLELPDAAAGAPKKAVKTKRLEWYIALRRKIAARKQNGYNEKLESGFPPVSPGANKRKAAAREKTRLEWFEGEAGKEWEERSGVDDRNAASGSI